VRLKREEVKILMKILLFQIRNPDDPMLEQEYRCFDTKLSPLRGSLEYQLDSHNIIGRPEGYEQIWSDYDLIMVGGSGDYGCVNNNTDWLQTFCEVLRRVVAADKPMFCSCFGHQALAKALGGEVSTDRSRSEVGTLEVTLNEDGVRDVLLSGLTSPFLAQFGHNDFVSRLPEGAVNLASTPLCAVQSYRLPGKLVYATQFHPELSHLENRERALRYLKAYDSGVVDPEKVEQMFRPSQSASDLLPRFVTMAQEMS
jgi:GMP synthase (glutamine-hydrolysing)